jgi:hypothetical protein
MPKLANRVLDTSTTTGTGDITVSGTPVSGYLALSTLGTGAVFDYTINEPTSTEFETGRGKTTGATTFSREQVLASSNSGALVNFSAGTKDVFVTVAAESMMSRGRALGCGNGHGVI